MPSQAGIGCRISRHENGIVIDEVVTGGAADRNGGVKNGDILLSIEGTKIMTLNQVRDLIVGPAGSNVNVTLVRDGSSVELAIERGHIESRNVPPKEVVLDNGQKLKTHGMRVNPTPSNKPTQPVTKSRPFVCSVEPGSVPTRVDLRKYMSEVEHQAQTNS